MAKGNERKTATLKVQAAVTVKLRWIEAVEKIGRSIIKYGALAFVSYMVFSSIQELAGKITLADISLVVEQDSSRVHKAGRLVLASLLFGIGGVLYGLYQARLRKRTIAHLSPYQQMWEMQQDPNRTSSNLTQEGNTKEEYK